MVNATPPWSKSDLVRLRLVVRRFRNKGEGYVTVQYIEDESEEEDGSASEVRALRGDVGQCLVAEEEVQKEPDTWWDGLVGLSMF